jgi:hypothetical protein
VDILNVVLSSPSDDIQGDLALTNSQMTTVLVPLED